MTKTKTLATCAVLVAMAFVLALLSEFIPLQLPFGGSVTLASMLPIVLISYIFGVKWGVGSAFIFAILQMILGAKTISALFLPGDEQVIWWKAVLICLLDYIVAFTVIGLAGIFVKKIKSNCIALMVGTAFALFLRYIVHIVSGALFYGMWAEWFFSEAGAFGQTVLSSLSGSALAWFYSVCYNGLYMIPEIILTTILAGVLATLLPKLVKPLNK